MYVITTNNEEVYHMNYTFPKNLYVDVRIEHHFSTNIKYTLKNLDECKTKEYSAAFIRLFDGNLWYYASTSDLNAIQDEIDSLAALATAGPDLESLPIYKNFSTHVDEKLIFAEKKLSDVPLPDKIDCLKTLMPFVENNPYMKLWKLIYLDEYILKEFYNSKGADLKWDFQRCGFALHMELTEGEKKFSESFQFGKTYFHELAGYEKELKELIAESENFLLNSVAVTPGTYPIVVTPMVTGVFTHECFGHKSESDFMVGDEATKKEWTLGKKIGPDDLSIIDTGLLSGPGYTPYDDEGNPATKTYLIKEGILTGRLHSADSAADLTEEVTGNARAKNFEFEPLVRMTTTYIDNGTKSVEEIIGDVKDGIYVKGIHHGSGMSTFTLGPSLAYTIKDGKIDQPVRISVISGNVFEALNHIDSIADDLEFKSFVTGGCGKMAQYPLSVGFAGPHIRIQNMQVQ